MIPSDFERKWGWVHRKKISANMWYFVQHHSSNTPDKTVHSCNTNSHSFNTPATTVYSCSSNYQFSNKTVTTVQPYSITSISFHFSVRKRAILWLLLFHTFSAVQFRFLKIKWTCIVNWGNCIKFNWLPIHLIGFILLEIMFPQYFIYRIIFY